MPAKKLPAEQNTLLSAIKTIVKTEVKSIRDEVQTLRVDIQNVQSEVKSLRTDVHNVQGAVQTLQVDMQHVQDGVINLRSDLQSVQGEVKSVREEIQASEKRIEEKITSERTILQIYFDQQLRKTNDLIKQTADNQESLKERVEVLEEHVFIQSS
jgi:chromosome segregation ATPase